MIRTPATACTVSAHSDISMTDHAARTLGDESQRALFRFGTRRAPYGTAAVFAWGLMEVASRRCACAAESRAFRFGVVRVSRDDFAAIARAMGRELDVDFA